MRVLIFVGALLALAPAPAEAQTCVGMTGCALGCACGDDACIRNQCGGPDGGAADAEGIAAAIAERERQFQISLDNARAAGVVQAQAAVQRHMDGAIKASDRQQWKVAISHLEAAMLLDPFNTSLQSSLDYARSHEMLELHAAEAAQGPVVAASFAPVSFADAIPADLPAATPDAEPYCVQVRDYFVEQAQVAAQERVNAALDELDVTTPWGLFLRVEMNVAQLARELPDWIMQAVNGEMSLEEARLLPMRATAMIFNVGTTPGEFAQRLVELKSAKLVALEAAEARATELVGGAITSLAEHAGAPAEIAERALELGQEHSERILKWIGVSD